MNLLKETTEVLQNHNKTWEDVEWVGVYDSEVSEKDWDYESYLPSYIDKDIFSQKIDREYDNGFGGAEVDENLKIVGKDFWLERHKYDGSEWWEYKTMPQKPKELNNDLIIFDTDKGW